MGSADRSGPRWRARGGRSRAEGSVHRVTSVRPGDAWPAIREPAPRVTRRAPRRASAGGHPGPRPGRCGATTGSRPARRAERRPPRQGPPRRQPSRGRPAPPGPGPRDATPPRSDRSARPARAGAAPASRGPRRGLRRALRRPPATRGRGAPASRGRSGGFVKRRQRDRDRAGHAAAGCRILTCPAGASTKEGRSEQSMPRGVQRRRCRDPHHDHGAGAQSAPGISGRERSEGVRDEPDDGHRDMTPIVTSHAAARSQRR
jgi:hypothetical protein